MRVGDAQRLQSSDVSLSRAPHLFDLVAAPVFHLHSNYVRVHQSEQPREPFREQKRETKMMNTKEDDDDDQLSQRERETSRESES